MKISPTNFDIQELDFSCDAVADVLQTALLSAKTIGEFLLK